MLPRPEHPKPQFERKNWKNLNGEWQFEIDHGNSGVARRLFDDAVTLQRTIQVPFCPESKLSGVQYTDFMSSVWYKRSVTLSEQELQGRVLLHFGAVDYRADVYLNGKHCGTHKGGYVSFCLDVTDFVHAGKNILTVHAQDDTRDPRIPSGKQSDRYHSYACSYTRTTGIWQTVWMEFVPETRIQSVRYYPDIHTACLTLRAELIGRGTLTVSAAFEGKDMGSVSADCNGGQLTLTLPLKEKHLWQVGDGKLYDLTLTYGEDTVCSYFGLRQVRLDGFKFLLNETSVFQRLILDQGFYPDGIYTAPSDAQLQADIDRSLAMGFNGARLHEKVFEERFLYHCDKKGYLVWGEYPNWGLDHTDPNALYSILPEWLEELERDFNHPAIIGWCPFNETWDQHGHPQHNPLLAAVYHATKAVDPTRPCIDTSGNFHVVTDIFDVHDYTDDPELLRTNYAELAEGKIRDRFADRQPYPAGKAFFVSEYGGIGWNVDPDAWGYNNTPKTPEEFLTRLKGLTDALLDHPCMMGLCYTQLTDVEQEQNGLYTYDRKPKFPAEQIHPIFARKAAIEQD